MLETKVHLGPRSAGNKSLLSYRAGHGITGYGGYCPSSESIPIPIKEGPSSSGAELNRERAQPSFVLDEEVAGRESTYQATINKSPKGKSGISTSKDFGEYTGGAEDAAPLPNQKFLGDSLYRSSYHSPTKRKEEAAETPFLMSPSRKKPAYLIGSSYAADYDNAMEMVHGQAWLENKEPKSMQSVYGSLWKEVIVQPDKMTYASRYIQDFGSMKTGIAAKPARHPIDQSLEATTGSLFQGSPKAFRRMPGYQGFLPAEGGGHQLIQQAEDHDRLDTKNFRLFGLAQYSQNVPGAGLYYPREVDNVQKMGKGNTSDLTGTTSNHAHSYLSFPENLAKVAKDRAESISHGCKMETKKFFSPGALQQSKNGSENSEKFYKIMRPYEALARIGRPSAVTESGYRFTCYTSKV